jgi:hypothetical protein
MEEEILRLNKYNYIESISNSPPHIFSSIEIILFFRQLSEAKYNSASEEQQSLA